LSHSPDIDVTGFSLLRKTFSVVFFQFRAVLVALSLLPLCLALEQ
jgi:hypothetical protein